MRFGARGVELSSMGTLHCRLQCSTACDYASKRILKAVLFEKSGRKWTFSPSLLSNLRWSSKDINSITLLDRWWRMLSSPLVSALGRDEEWVCGMLRAAEADPWLRVDQVEELRAESADTDTIGSVTRLRVQGRRTKQLNQFSKTLVLKWPGQISSAAFSNEARMLGSVVPALARTIADRRWRGVKNSELLPFPRCLHASDNLIVLDDLAARGLKACDRSRGLDHSHATATFKALGRFHALSFSLKHQDPQAFDQTVTQAREVVFVAESAPVFAASLEHSLHLAISCLKQCPEQAIYDAVQVLQSLQGKTFRTIASLVAPRGPLTVLSHGDFWVDNVLFSHNGDEVSQVVLTDLQVARHSSLATDILHLMYTSLEPGLARDCGDDLIKCYHESLSETIAKLTPTAPPIALESVMEEIESHALYGLLMSFLVLPNIANSAHDSSESTEYYSNKFSFTYQKRVRDIVLEFVERGYI